MTQFTCGHSLEDLADQNGHLVLAAAFDADAQTLRATLGHSHHTLLVGQMFGNRVFESAVDSILEVVVELDLERVFGQRDHRLVPIAAHQDLQHALSI